MRREIALASFAILILLVITQSAAKESTYSQVKSMNPAQGESCERLYNQCIGCKGARVCEPYCYRYLVTCTNNT